MRVPRKYPPTTPQTPTPIQVALNTNQAASRARAKVTVRQMASPAVVYIHPKTDKNIRTTQAVKTRAIPAVTQGNQRLPQRATIGPPKSMMSPRIQGFSPTKEAKPRPSTVAQPASWATTTLRLQGSVS